MNNQEWIEHAKKNGADYVFVVGYSPEKEGRPNVICFHHEVEKIPPEFLDGYVDAVIKAVCDSGIYEILKQRYKNKHKEEGAAN